jgi:hypothetical protein
VFLQEYYVFFWLILGFLVLGISCDVEWNGIFECQFCVVNFELKVNVWSSLFSFLRWIGF